VTGSAGLCFWHDPHATKAGLDVRRELEDLVKAQASLEGFQLQGAELQNANLTSGTTKWRVNLTYADLTRADLRGAHLFNVDFRYASLLKADLTGANLNRCRLRHANLLRADFEDARLEHVDWGNSILQEPEAHAARRAGEHGRARDLFIEAEETYRILSMEAEQRGHWNLSGQFLRKEMVMGRMQMDLWSFERAWSKLVDLLCGYGQSPARTIGFSFSFILVCAVIYYIFGVVAPEGFIAFDAGASLNENVWVFLTCFYYSVVTFTTLGYGDITPVGHLRPIAAAEAFIGSFAIALFVVVFVRRMVR
jgi:hypothetical protein